MWVPPPLSSAPDLWICGLGFRVFGLEGLGIYRASRIQVQSLQGFWVFSLEFTGFVSGWVGGWVGGRGVWEGGVFSSRDSAAL